MNDADRPPLSPASILAVARRLVGDGGVDAVSLRRLAKELGVTAPALYAHFGSKAELLAALADDEFSALLEVLDESATGVEEPVERIRAQCRAYVGHARSHPALFEVMTMFRPAWVPQPAASESQFASRSFDAAIASVQEAVDAGEIGEPDALLAALTLWSAAHGVATVLLSRPQLGDEFESELVDSVIDSVIEGLRRR